MGTEQIGPDSYIESKLKEMQEKLRQYEASLSFSVKSEHTEATRLMTIGRSELNKMSAEDCGCAAFELIQYSIFLQKTVNYEVAAVKWLESAIDITIAPRISQYQAYGFQEKKLAAVNGDGYAKAANRLRQIAQSRVDDLQFISNKVQDLAQVLLSLQQTKRGQRNG